MRQTLDERRWVGSTRQDLVAPAVSHIDREALESVMREDVFLAADGRALSLDIDAEPPRQRVGGLSRGHNRGR